MPEPFTITDLVLVQALEIVRDNGVPVFPCRPDKKPTCPGGFHRATAVESELRELWREFPGRLIGVPMNAESNLFCLDVDLIKHPEAQTWLDANAHRLPPTRVHQTQSGGFHFFFQHQAGLGNTAGKIHKGVDTRGDNKGYCIWWPEHIDGLHVLVAPAPVPTWLADLVNPPPPPRWLRPIGHALPISNGDPVKRLVAIIARIARAQEGERNALLFWGANRVNEMIEGGELEENEIANAIDALFEVGARIGRERSEVKASIESAMK